MGSLCQKRVCRNASIEPLTLISTACVTYELLKVRGRCRVHIIWSAAQRRFARFQSGNQIWLNHWTHEALLWWTHVVWGERERERERKENSVPSLSIRLGLLPSLQVNWNSWGAIQREHHPFHCGTFLLIMNFFPIDIGMHVKYKAYLINNSLASNTLRIWKHLDLCQLREVDYMSPTYFQFRFK